MMSQIMCLGYLNNFYECDFKERDFFCIFINQRKMPIIVHNYVVFHYL